MNRPFDAVSWMWSEAVSMLENAERQHRKFFTLIGHDTSPKWEPPVDIYETDDGLTILVALPGVTLDRVSLFVDANGLVVHTERAPLPADEYLRIQRMEIPYGTYERRIDLPAGRYTLREQRMADGFLELRLSRE